MTLHLSNWDFLSLYALGMVVLYYIFNFIDRGKK